MDKETLIVKKCLLLFFGAGLLIICAVGSFNALNVRYHGIQRKGRIVSFERYMPYSSRNRLRPYRYAVKIQFQDPEGKTQTLDAVLSQEDQWDFHADLGTELPFWVVPATGQYSIGEKPPGLGIVIAANLLLLPAALVLFVFGFKTRIQ